MRPFFPFYGSKWNIARHYPAPLYSRTIEPFAGSAGYSTFYGVPEAHLIDADPIIVGVWDYLLRVTAAEVFALPELPEAGDSVVDQSIPQEAKWLIGFWLNRGSASPKLSRTAYSVRSDRGQLNWGPRAKERIASQLERIEGWTVRLGDFASAPRVPATWFVDPPYVDKGRFYRTKFDKFDRLGQWAQQQAGQVIVCEGAGAEWLPFAPLGDFKSSLGKAHEQVWLSVS